MDRQRVFYLLDRHADGAWSAEERQELEVYLQNSAEVRAWFWEHAQLSGLLREACLQELGAEMVEIDGPAGESSGDLASERGPAAPVVFGETTGALIDPMNASDAGQSTDSGGRGSIEATRNNTLGVSNTGGAPSASAAANGAPSGRQGLPGPVSNTSLSPDTAETINKTAALGIISDVFSGRSGTVFGGGFSNFPVLLLVALVAMLAGAGAMAMWLGMDRASEKGLGPDVDLIAAMGDSNAVSPPATVIGITNCRWDPSRSTADVLGGTVRPGQSLHLLEGVAEVCTHLGTGGFGRFQLEGPLSMILTSNGMPNLQYGKMTAVVSCGFERYSLDTAMGRIVVPLDASFGVIASANDLELHVFDGEALIEPLWPIDFHPNAERMVAKAGTSLRVEATAMCQNLHRGQANRRLFSSQVSMAASRLEIPAEYVAAVHKSGPFCYWRFEAEQDGMVRNEIDDRLHLNVEGDGLIWRVYPGNRAVELGANGEISYLISDDSIDDIITNDYSLEAWVKPSHFHQGAVFSLIQEPPSSKQPVGSGLLVEMCGPSASWRSLYPGRLRFLHRNPPAVFSGGTSAYSSVAYETRKWQHIVATKAGSEMCLYLDGKCVARGKDETPTIAGMRVLVGQLYPIDERRSVIARPFIGELDEVALYNRALKEKEIVSHFELANSTADSILGGVLVGAGNTGNRRRPPAGKIEGEMPPGNEQKKQPAEAKTSTTDDSQAKTS